MKEDDKIVKKAAKEILAPYGIRQKGQTRGWHDDNNWFITLIEFQRTRTPGAALNIGINFLWTPKEYLSYDYWHGTIDSLGAAVEHFYKYFNDDSFYERMQKHSKIALEQALFYREFQDINLAKSHILRHKSLMDNLWGAWDKAMICFMAEDIEEGRKYFDIFSQYVHQHNDWINNFVKEQTARFQPHLGDSKMLKQLVLETITKQREFFKL
jgi:hypothetical protein